MLLAKPVIPNQYWILRDDDRKVGNIEAGPNGVQIRIDNHVETFKDIRLLKKKVKISWQDSGRDPAPQVSAINEVNGFHTTSKPYNSIFDVRHQVPLWTKEPRSKSWYAAGWYCVKHGRSWRIVECPKLITLERYAYQGPFQTRDQASGHIHQ